MQNTIPIQQVTTIQPQRNQVPTNQEKNIKRKGTMTNITNLTLPQKFWMALASSVVLVLILTTLPRMIFRPSSIQVIGEGKLDFEADQVSMVVTRVNSGVSSTATINEGDIGVNLLIDSAKNVAGEDLEIKKAFYQVQPVATATGIQYQVANAFSVEFSDITKTNQMIKTLYNDGATSVSNVTFESADKEKTSQEARNLAVKDAKEEAKSIAKAAGKRVGRLISITDDNQEVSSSVSTLTSESSSANFSNVSVTKVVSVIYEIW